MHIAGKWRITEAELWDCDALNLVAPAFIEFAEDGSSGSFGFIAVQGEMDCREVERDGRPGVEFSWEGNDECDPASGRGWAVLEEDGSLCGRIFFHLGDGPLPCWGWGDIPDQYGRRRDGDDGSSPMPKTPDGLADLPPILPGWGPRRARPAASPADGSSIRYRDLIT